MSYDYKILATSLHATADAAIEWFEKRWGIKKSTVKVETPVHTDIAFRPTFIAYTRDFHVLCVEVADTIYTNTLDTFVLDCREKALPVRLFVAVQKGLHDPDYAKKFKLAKRAGVGILEVDSTSGDVIQNALSLSLTGVRPIEPKDFPKKYREPLQQAEQTFRDGQPAKACSMVYDELEAAFRRFALKCHSKGFWPNKNKLRIKKTAWAKLITDIDKDLDRTHPINKRVSNVLLSRVHGTTPYRNEAGHKPESQAQLIRRDRELRTRYEGALDLLRDFLAATKGFNV